MVYAPPKGEIGVRRKYFGDLENAYFWAKFESFAHMATICLQERITEGNKVERINADNKEKFMAELEKLLASMGVTIQINCIEEEEE